MVRKSTLVTLYCPDCGSDRIISKGYFETDRNLDYYRCETCKVFFTWPLQEKRISKLKRDALIKLVELGLGNKDISYVLGIKPDTVYSIRKRLENNRMQTKS